MPVSSSRVMNITPLALPGFCRTSTRPATVSRSPVRHGRGVGAGHRSVWRARSLAQERDGMLAQRQADMVVVLRPPRRPAVIGFSAHRRLVDLRHDRACARAAAAANSGSGSSRSALMAQSASRRARRERRPEGIRLGEPDEARDRHAGAAPQVVDAGEGLIGAGGDELRGIGVGEAADHAHAEPDGEPALADRLQRAVPARAR